MPVKGPRPYMDAALRSLRTQDADDDLEIIVQDGDAEPDRGQSDALNRGFARARGEWLFWLNADDLLLPGALAAVRNCIDSCRDAQWIAGNVMEIDAEGKVLRCLWDRGHPFAYAGLPVRVYGPSSFFRQTLLEEAGGLDADLRCCMDTDLWCKFRAAGHWYRKVPDYLWGFRVHDGSMTRSSLRPPEELARQRAEVVRVNERHGMGDSWWRSLRLRTARLLDGGYAKSSLDTLRWRGSEA